MSSVWHRRQSSDSESHCNAVRLFKYIFFFGFAFRFTFWISFQSAWPKSSIVSHFLSSDCCKCCKFPMNRSRVEPITPDFASRNTKTFSVCRLNVPRIMQKSNGSWHSFFGLAFSPAFAFGFLHVHRNATHSFLLLRIFCVSLSVRH